VASPVERVKARQRHGRRVSDVVQHGGCFKYLGIIFDDRSQRLGAGRHLADMSPPAL
jgi:hypothetical protein